MNRLKISREIKTAFIVFGGIILFLLGFTYLKSSAVFESSRKFYAVYSHSGGLEPATPVTVNGFQVGKVTNVQIINETAKILVTFTVDKGFEFSKNSKAELYSSLLGSTGLQIVPTFDNGPMAQPGDTIPSATQKSTVETITSKIEPLEAKLSKTLISADSVLVGVAAVLDQQGRENLKSSLEHLNATMASLRTASQSLNYLMNTNKAEMDASLKNVHTITANFAKMSDSLAEANLGQTVNDIQNTVAGLNKVLASIENGEGSVGKLLKDEQLYQNLSGASLQLEQLLEDMKLNPKRYVHFSLFGRKQVKYESSETNEN